MPLADIERINLLKALKHLVLLYAKRFWHLCFIQIAGYASVSFKKKFGGSIGRRLPDLLAVLSTGRIEVSPPNATALADTG
jgi:hypothetical protein